ncbi:MAG TPA: ABC transporter permease [Tepidisphaeraceae bacterium]|jgi:putative ABC transport system permease protein|nr:ABC transporter permease [Tepidisphaeraceae bacterium]
MFFTMIIKVALKAMLANKLRSTLAMLGIIIGVGAVIAMLAIGSGAQKAIMDRFTAFGTNLLTVRPGQKGTGGVMSGTQQNLTVEDGIALTEVPGVSAVAPSVSGRVQVKYLSKNARTDCTGTTVTYFPIRNYEIESGKPFNDLDCDAMARVCVIGPVTATNLFGAEDPVDKTIKLNGINFRVVGVLKAKGDQGYYNPDDQAIVPYTTAMKELFGLTYVRDITCRVADDSDIDKTQEAIFAVMRKRHRVQPGQPDDVEIRNQAEFLTAATQATDTFTYLLGSVAAISLLVGGIGIMNIMLVSVTERTREIGIRKAIGAKDRDILRQFLIEAILMSGIGGVVGVALGIGIAKLVPILTHGSFQTLIQIPGIVIAIGFSAAVGIFFGYYPAVRAARLDPIEALRYE